MENYRSQLSGVNVAVSFLFILMILGLAGCQTISMPDMSNYNLGVFDNPMITIKQNYNKVNIRPTPSTNQEPIAIVRGGDSLELLEERGNWLYVEFYDTTGNKKTGWLYKFLAEGYEKPADEPGATEHRKTSDPPGSEDRQPTEHEQQPTPEKDISIL